MSDLDIMKTPELLAYIKRLETENAALRRFADLGPYYLLGQGGFLVDLPSRRYTDNLREATAFPDWQAADDFGRGANLKWWSILRVAYWDTEHGLLDKAREA